MLYLNPERDANSAANPRRRLPPPYGASVWRSPHVVELIGKRTMFGGWTMPAYFFRSEPGAAELRRLARRESGRVCQRVLMIANMLEGMEHEEAARLAGLSRSAAYDWHNRYEEEGIEGLRDRPRPGRQPRVDAVTSARLQGTDCRWRRAGAGRGGGVSWGRRATHIEGGV